jgi:hypothetical protein
LISNIQSALVEWFETAGEADGAEVAGQNRHASGYSNDVAYLNGWTGSGLSRG